MHKHYKAMATNAPELTSVSNRPGENIENTEVLNLGRLFSTRPGIASTSYDLNTYEGLCEVYTEIMLNWPTIIHNAMLDFRHIAILQELTDDEPADGVPGLDLSQTHIAFGTLEGDSFTHGFTVLNAMHPIHRAVVAKLARPPADHRLAA